MSAEIVAAFLGGAVVGGIVVYRWVMRQVEAWIEERFQRR